MKRLLICLVLLLSSCSLLKDGSKSEKNSLGFTTPTVKDSSWIEDALDVETLSVAIPKINSWFIENGIEVNFLEDSSLPIVSGTLLIPDGIYLAKQQGHALALEALGSLMRIGGAGEHSPEDLDLKITKLAASVSVNFGAENASISFSCLKESLEELLPILKDIIFNPQIDLQRLESWKKQKIASIKARKDSPNDMASIAFNQLLNLDTNFQKLSTIKEVEALTRADILKLHRAYVIPNKAKLVLTGDLREQEARQLALDYFAKWPLSQNFQEKLLEPTPTNARGIYFISGDFQQSTIVIGHRGLPRLTKDHYAIQVFNDIFGAKGFTSRLTDNIRKKKGWAYVTYGGMYEDVIPGKNLIYLQTQSEQSVLAMEEGIRTLVELQKDGATLKELENVKRNISNSFVFEYDNYAKIVNRYTLLKLLQFPEGYQENFLKNINQVTLPDVQSVGSLHWNIKDFIMVVVGPSSTYNLLETAVKNPESFLYDYPLKKISFNEQAEL